MNNWEGVLPPRLRIEAVKGFPLPTRIAGGWVFRGSHSMPVLLGENMTTKGSLKIKLGGAVRRLATAKRDIILRRLLMLK